MKTDRSKQVLQQAHLAFVLLSRLPLPALPNHAFAHGARAVWAYPLVGIVLGGVAVTLGWSAQAVGVPVELAAGLMLVVLVLLSGALHEDGLADTADGFWGGHTRARRLEIMKDSHIGTYGVLALFCVTALRWICYTAILPVAPLALIATASLSRGVMPAMMAALPHARETGLSQSVGRPSVTFAGLSVTLGLMVAILLSGPVAFALVLFGLGTALGVGVLAKAKIGGQTGDVLGATQQLAEVAMLMFLTLVIT